MPYKGGHTWVFSKENFLKNVTNLKNVRKNVSKCLQILQKNTCNGFLFLS